MKKIFNWQGAMIKVNTSPKTFKKHGFKKLRAGQKVLAPCGNFCTIDGVERSWNSICLWYTIDGENFSTKVVDPIERDFKLPQEIIKILTDKKTGKTFEVDTSPVAFKKMGLEGFYSGQTVTDDELDICVLEGIGFGCDLWADQKVLWCSRGDKLSFYKYSMAGRLTPSE